MTEHRGAGDRWLAGERPAGVDFGRHDAVELTAGRYAGARGTVELLIALAPEPRYLVALADGRGDVRARQSELRRA